MARTVADKDRPMERVGLHRKHCLDLLRRIEKYTRKRNWHRRNKAIRRIVGSIE